MSEDSPTQITLNLPDNLSQMATFSQSDWLREIAIALFQKERISLARSGLAMIVVSTTLRGTNPIMIAAKDSPRTFTPEEYFACLLYTSDAADE